MVIPSIYGDDWGIGGWYPKNHPVFSASTLRGADSVTCATCCVLRSSSSWTSWAPQLPRRQSSTCRFPKMEVPQNGWFTLENPTKWMIWGYHYFSKPPFWEARFHDASGLRNMTHSKVTDLYFCRWWNQSFSGNNLNMLSIRVGKICHNLCQLPTFDGKPFEFLDDDMWRLFLRLFLSRCCACVSETNHEDCEKYIKIHEPWLNQYIYCGFYPMPFAPSPKTITMFIGCINYSPVVDGMVWPTWTTWIEAPKASLRWFLHSEHRWTWPMSRY